MSEAGPPPGYRDPGERDYLIGRIEHLTALLRDLSVRSERLTRYEAAQILRSHPTHTMKPTLAKAWAEVIETLCPARWLEVDANQDRTKINDELSGL